MSAFILDYGTFNNDHVAMDLSKDAVSVAFINGDPEWVGTVAEFETKFPEIVNEMISNGVIRRN